MVKTKKNEDQAFLIVVVISKVNDNGYSIVIVLVKFGACHFNMSLFEWDQSNA